MFCSKCGTKMEEQDRFCKACGAPVMMPLSRGPEQTDKAPGEQASMPSPSPSPLSSEDTRTPRRPWVAEFIVNIMAMLVMFVNIVPMFFVSALSFGLAPFIMMLNADMDFAVILLLLLLTCVSGGAAILSVIFRIIAYSDAKKKAVSKSNKRIVTSCILIAAAALIDIPIVFISYNYYDPKDFSFVIMGVAIILSIAVTVMSIVDSKRMKARLEQ